MVINKIDQQMRELGESLLSDDRLPGMVRITKYDMMYDDDEDSFALEIFVAVATGGPLPFPTAEFVYQRRRESEPWKLTRMRGGS